MRQPDHVIRAFLAAVRDGCAAEMVSVFVPTWPDIEAPILLHSGQEPAVPELADIATASAFIAHLHEHDGTSAVPSQLATGALLPIPLVTSLWQESPSTARFPGRAVHPSRRVSDRHGTHVGGWLGLRFPVERAAQIAIESDRQPGLALGQSALGLAARLASLYLFLYDSLADPLTGLPGRSVLRTLLRRELSLARSERAPLSLLLFNADDFAQVNATWGRDVGDQVLREVVSHAHATLRFTDLLCRHGAATFGVILTNSGRESAAIVADKLQARLAGSPYLDERISLTFSIGTTSLSADEPAPQDSVDFIGQAEAALAMAKQSGGAQTCTWRAGAAEATEPLDRLRHAFTGDQDRDYRNMGLLWDTVGLLASSSSPIDLARRVTRQLRHALSASLVAFFEPGSGGLELQYALLHRGESKIDSDVESVSVAPELLAVAEQAASTHTPAWSAPSSAQPGGAVAGAIPLVVDGHLLAVLLFAGTAGYISVDETDLRLMVGLAGPLGLALERARAAERKRQQDDLEKRRLVGELKGLRTALR
jgi:diguanylate cyclase (GGDEF)-like protein